MADRRTLYLGSANLTESAAHRNIDAGVLVDGGAPDEAVAVAVEVRLGQGADDAEDAVRRDQYGVPHAGGVRAGPGRPCGSTVRRSPRHTRASAAGLPPAAPSSRPDCSVARPAQSGRGHARRNGGGGTRCTSTTA
nr:hypothetical protein [Streptomyces sp. GC420]